MKKAILFSLIGIGLFSCNKVLDTTPTDFFSPDLYYLNEDHMNRALASVYDQLQKGSMYTGEDGLLTQFNITDEMYFGQSGTGPRIYNYTAGDGLALRPWTACYTAIERANLLLANIKKPVMDETKRKYVEGEARFLRAYFYFVLVQNYGAVPFKTEPTADPFNVNIARTPANEIYDFIIKEMTTAEGLVAPITTTGPGRISQSAVQGILARVCLYKAGFPNNDAAKYADALAWSKKCIDSHLHSLNPSYPQIFINVVQNIYDIKESIWEMELYTTGVGDVAGEYSAGLSTALGIAQTNAAFARSAGSYRIHPYLYNLYEKDPNIQDIIPEKALDLRRDWAIAPYTYNTTAVPAGAISPNKTYFTTAQIWDRTPNKWDRVWETQIPADKKFQSNTGTNTIMLRYADVLLMYAEADNAINGPQQAAIDSVNAIRRRGYGKYANGEWVKSITVSNQGTGYTTAPTITVNGGGGSGATAVATVAGGKVTSIVLTNHGKAFTSVPTIAISGGGGTGAIATATLSQITDADLKPADYASKDKFLQTIQEERARELCFEGWRRLDLRRWGILLERVRAVGNDAAVSTASPNFRPFAKIPGDNINEVHLYLPIPVAELGLNKLLTQNPGW